MTNGFRERTNHSVQSNILLLFYYSLFCLGCRENRVASNPSFISDPPSSDVNGFNFVIVLTDDQRWDTLSAMPIVQDRLVTRGVTFSNAVTSTPLCCPARASLLAGGFLCHQLGRLIEFPYYQWRCRRAFEMRTPCPSSCRNQDTGRLFLESILMATGTLLHMYHLVGQDLLQPIIQCILRISM